MAEISLSNNNLRYIYNEFPKPGIKVNNNFTKPDFTTRTVKQDTIELSKDKYAADDGKISFKDKLKNFAKGLVKPVTTMFSSPKNFIIGAGAIALGGVLIAATGGAIAPVMVAAGIIGGGIQFGKSAYLAATAKTDDEARNAWQGMGTGTFTVASSVAGAKGALKSAGINTEGMNCIQASAKCITSSPAQVGKSLSNITSSNAFNQLKILSKNQEKSKIKTDGEPAKTTPEAKPVEENIPVKSEVKAEQPKTPEVQQKPAAKPEAQIGEENIQIKNEVKPEQPKTPEVQQKPAAKPEAQIGEENIQVKNEVKPEQPKTPEVQQKPAAVQNEGPKSVGNAGIIDEIPKITQSELRELNGDPAKLEAYLQQHGKTLDDFDNALIELMKKVKIDELEGESFYDHVFKGIKEDTNINSDTIFCHGTTKEYGAAIMENGFDLNKCTHYESGKGIYTVTYDPSSDFAYGDGTIIKMRLRNGAKIADLGKGSATSSINDAAYSLQGCQFDQGIKSSKLLNDSEFIKAGIVRILQKMGYSGATTSSANARVPYTVIWNPADVSIL